MSWHFDFNATTREAALRAWDQKVAGLNEYVRSEAAPEFAAMRASIDRLINLPSVYYSVKTYGDHCKDDTKAPRPTHLRAIFFEIKWYVLEG